MCVQVLVNAKKFHITAVISPYSAINHPISKLESGDCTIALSVRRPTSTSYFYCIFCISFASIASHLFLSPGHIRVIIRQRFLFIATHHRYAFTHSRWHAYLLTSTSKYVQDIYTGNAYNLLTHLLILTCLLLTDSYWTIYQIYVQDIHTKHTFSYIRYSLNYLFAIHVALAIASDANIYIRQILRYKCFSCVFYNLRTIYGRTQSCIF